MDNQHERFSKMIDSLPSTGKVLVGGRIAKLIHEGKAYLVVGEHEPYYMAVYAMIRENEKTQGTWTPADEIAYQEAK